MVTKPQYVDTEWFGLDKDGLRLIVRRRENSEVLQVSVTKIKRQEVTEAQARVLVEATEMLGVHYDDPMKVSEQPLAFIAKELEK